MNARERFAAIARGLPVDAPLYVEEVVRQEVLDRWYAEGLPQSVTEATYRESFGVHRFEYVYTGLQTKAGTLKSPAGFRRFRQSYLDNRLDIQTEGFWREKAGEFKGRDWPLGIMGWRGFMLPLFTQEEEWDSLVDVMLALHDQPRLVKQALEFVTEQYLELLDLALARVDFDFGVVSEPIASRVGPVISPADFREFVLPCHKRIVAFFHGRGIWPVLFRSMCNVKPILPDVAQSGVDGLWISQVGGILDVRDLRRQHPDKLLIGGLDSTTLPQGEAAIRAEVMGKVPSLLAAGRYLPMLDDNPREHVSYDAYLCYRQALKEACEGVPPLAAG